MKGTSGGGGFSVDGVSSPPLTPPMGPPVPLLGGPSSPSKSFRSTKVGGGGGGGSEGSSQYKAGGGGGGGPHVSKVKTCAQEVMVVVVVWLIG
jgi:hypothetical protein